MSKHESQSDDFDPWDYIDKSDAYRDYDDIVYKRVDGEIYVKRSHNIYLPGERPSILSTLGREIIPLESLTPEALTQVNRIAAGLVGGDRPISGKSFEFFYWDHDRTNHKVTLKNESIADGNKKIDTPRQGEKLRLPSKEIVEQGSLFGEVSVHDNVLYGYVVINEHFRNASYKIILYTEGQAVKPEYVDIIFYGVLVHHFEQERMPTVISDIEEYELKQSYIENKETFRRLKNYSWPIKYDNEKELFTVLKEKRIKAFKIDSSVGLEGWVWAEKIEILKRSEHKRFD